MKFLATVFTILATSQAVAAFNDNIPTRNLKGRQVVAKPETMTQETRPLTHLPAESRIVEGPSKQDVAMPKTITQKTKPLKKLHSTQIPAESYGDGSIALYAVADDSGVLITSSIGSIGKSQTNVVTVPDVATRSSLPNKKVKKSKNGDQ
jgi:hypothetical protein